MPKKLNNKFSEQNPEFIEIAMLLFALYFLPFEKAVIKQLIYFQLQIYAQRNAESVH
jgi:hypothetical protein